MCLGLCGCVPHTELNKRAIVEALGIDYDGSQYKVTFQYYNLSGAGSRTQIDPSKPNVLTAKGTGSSVYAALKDAEFNCGRELMLGITQIIVIGREAAKQPLKSLISFSAAFYESHPKVKLAIADDTAEKVLSVKFTEGSVSTQKLSFMFETAEKSGYVGFPSMLDTFIDLSGKHGSLCLPLLQEVDDGSDVTKEGKNVLIKGGVIFRDGVYCAEIDTEETSGLALLDGKAENTTVIVDYEGARVAVEIFDIKTAVLPAYQDGRLIFTVKTTCGGKYLDSFIDEADASPDDQIERLCAQQLIQRMETATAALLEANADVLRLQLLLKHHSYTDWLKTSEQWEQLFPESLFVFETSVEISRYSLEE